MSVTSVILFSLLSTSPDVCGVLARDGVSSRYCGPSRIDEAPPLDQDVCCDGSICTQKSPTAGCPNGQTQYYAEFGKVDTDGRVWPYFEVPDWCDLHPCAGTELTLSPQSFFLCCRGEDCTKINNIFSYQNECPMGDLLFCFDGVCNADGFIECLDE